MRSKNLAIAIWQPCLQGAVALLAQRDQETLEERARLEQRLPDRLQKKHDGIKI